MTASKLLIFVFKSAADVYPHLDALSLTEHTLEKFNDLRMPNESISWINMPIYEALKRQLATDLAEKNYIARTFAPTRSLSSEWDNMDHKNEDDESLFEYVKKGRKAARNPINVLQLKMSDIGWCRKSYSL